MGCRLLTRLLTLHVCVFVCVRLCVCGSAAPLCRNWKMYNIPNRIIAGWIPSGVIRPKGSVTSAVIASASTPTFGATYPVALYINASDGST